MTNLPVCPEKWAALICSKSAEQHVAFPVMLLRAWCIVVSSTLNSYFPKTTAARILWVAYTDACFKTVIPKPNFQDSSTSPVGLELQHLCVLRSSKEEGMHVHPFLHAMYPLSSPNSQHQLSPNHLLHSPQTGVNPMSLLCHPGVACSELFVSSCLASPPLTHFLETCG